MNLKYRISILLSTVIFVALASFNTGNQQLKKPNILFVISDDQSFGHTSFAGSTFINTPGFDRIAREGVYFKNCYAGSPGCAPSRSALITGRYPWQNEQSGQHASSWMKKYVPFVDELEANGYSTGRTGKGVSPFQYARNTMDSLWRETNAAGKTHSSIKYDGDTLNLPTRNMSAIDYFENFKYFIENISSKEPFFFWFGASEPHRAYEKGSWKRFGKKLADVKVPGFLPDTEEIRADLLDYAVEIEWFDSHLQKMITYLEEIGELENTIIIVTSDNGMPFPRAKANSFEYGVHVPLAIRYPKKFSAGRTVYDRIGFVDFAPTLLEITATEPKTMMPISGKSFLNILESDRDGTIDKVRKYSFVGRERHSSSRYRNLGYPQRGVFSEEYAFIWNMQPERWPAGAPQKYDSNDTTVLLPIYGLNNQGSYITDAAFTDVDDCPTKTYIIENKETDSIARFFDYSYGKRPEFELYNIKIDPYCLTNLAGNSEFLSIESKLRKILLEELYKSKDPRIVGPDKEVFESYKRYSRIRKFPKPL